MFFNRFKKKRHNCNFKFSGGYKTVNTKKQKNDTDNKNVLNIDNRNRFLHKNNGYNEYYRQNTPKYDKRGSYYGKSDNKKYIGSGSEVKRDYNVSNFPKKYKIQKFNKDYNIGNIEDEEYKSLTICVEKYNTISENEVRQMIDFDKNGNLILKKKNMTNKDVRKIIKYAFSKMYYAVSVEDPDVIIPIDPLYFNEVQKGGQFDINEEIHPCSLKDKNGKAVEPSSFKEKLTRLMISKMRYPHPYPYTDTVHRANKVYEYQTDIRVLDHSFIEKSIDTTNNRDVDEVVRKMVEYIKRAESQNKDSVVSLPIAIRQEEHAVLLTCSFDRKRKTFNVRVLNTNNDSQGLDLYGKPIFLAIRSLLPKYLKEECRLRTVYTELGNQVGPTCMEYAEREGYNTVRRNKNGITQPEEVIHNCLLRAGQCELSKMLGLTTDIREPEVKKIERLTTSSLDDYKGTILQKKIQKDYKNKQSRDDIFYKNNYDKSMYKNTREISKG